jgi:RNA polymerase sigma-70 factor, ECF subfamily
LMLFTTGLKNLSDEKLMERICEGSERGLEVMYHRYSQPLLRYFYKMLWKNRTLAEDFLQDLFIKILQTKNFDASRKFSTWVYSVAHNMCKNEYRKQAFRASANFRSTDFIEEKISSELDRQTFSKVVESILQQEDEDSRTMFVLRFELDMDIIEIANILQCPQGTIKSRIFYLKKKLAMQLSYFKTVLENE